MLRLLLYAVSAAMMVSGSAEPFRKPLISAERRIHVIEWSLNERDVQIPGPRGVTISKQTLHGGKQEAVDLITINNGKLTISVTPTRGMGILKVESSGLRLGWDSPVKEIVHPQFITL